MLLLRSQVVGVVGAQLEAPQMVSINAKDIKLRDVKSDFPITGNRFLEPIKTGN